MTDSSRPLRKHALYKLSPKPSPPSEEPNPRLRRRHHPPADPGGRQTPQPPGAEAFDSISVSSGMLKTGRLRRVLEFYPFRFPALSLSPARASRSSSSAPAVSSDLAPRNADRNRQNLTAKGRSQNGLCSWAVICAAEVASLHRIAFGEPVAAACSRKGTRVGRRHKFPEPDGLWASSSSWNALARRAASASIACRKRHWAWEAIGLCLGSCCKGDLERLLGNCGSNL